MPSPTRPGPRKTGIKHRGPKTVAQPTLDTDVEADADLDSDLDADVESDPDIGSDAPPHNAENLRRWVAPEWGAERLDRALAEAFPDLSRTRIQALIAEGQVLVDGTAPLRRVPGGALVTLRLPEARPTELVAEDLPLTILYQDPDLLVIDKAAGMVVHPGPGHSSGTLVHALLHHLRAPGGGRPALSSISGDERPGIVHRLDVGTSGVMVVACNDAAHRGLSEQFAVHSIDRRYLAIIHKVPLHDGGVIRSSLGRDPEDRLRFVSRPDGRPAVTHWRVRARGERVALVECRLETGRTHQIRVHLTEAGHSLLGDRTYQRRDCTASGALRPLVEALKRPMLHAWVLAFTHPRTGERLRFSTPLPPDFVEMAKAAGLALPASALPG